MRANLILCVTTWQLPQEKHVASASFTFSEKCAQRGLLDAQVGDVQV